MRHPGEETSRAMPERLAESLFAWLRRCQANSTGYDRGGIADSLDGRVAGEHYATTHFAWCCALRRARREDPALLDAARRAVGFHLRTSPQEYLPGSWSYHWDFNNLAFVETYRLLESELEEEERASWKAGLKSWKTNPHWAVNWVAMRALAHFERAEALGVAEDRDAAESWLAYVLEAQKPDGGIEDVKGKSLPSQYHAYSACLLHRMLPRHPSVPWAVKRAARWLLAVTAPDGEMNALGRGQGQIFGYACAAYLFRAAAGLDAELAPHHRWAERAVLERLARFQTPEGWLPLVLNDLPVESRAGWYDYHHLSVYNAFAAVWLTLAAGLDAPSGPALPPPEGEVWLKDSGLLAVRRKRWFALFGAGQEGAGYLTEPGVTPNQVFWEGRNLFRYPLGPGTGKYGSLAEGRGQEAHCWAPLWRDSDGQWQAPAGAAGTLERGSGPGRWRLGLSAKGAEWRRELVVGQRFLEARDALEFPGRPAGSPPPEARVQNFALDGSVPWENGPACIRDQDGKAVLRAWGAGPLAKAGEVETAAGRSDIWAATGRVAASSGWRLRQGPSDFPGALPGIVCLSWDPWSNLWKRKQRLLFELARSGRSPKTLYIEPSITVTQACEGLGGLFGSEGGRLRRGLRGGLTDLGHGLMLGSPLLPWPGQRTFPRLARANHRAWLRQLHRFTERAYLPGGYVLWLYHPTHLAALDVLGQGAELVVYDWTDDWAEALPADRGDAERQALEDLQRELLCRADVVFAVSRSLAERAGEFCPQVHHLPNATDPQVFRPRDPAGPPHPLASRGPLLVYLSQITERLDVGLVAEVARARPGWTLILAGPVACAPELLDPLRGLDNVVLTGPLPYEEAGALAGQADVCLLPHRQDALTRSLDPIKLYDYLATGRPIVSTDVAMHPDLAGLVRVATTPGDFVAAVESALSESPSEAERRIRAASGHTWAARAEQAASILERFFPEEPPCA